MRQITIVFLVFLFCVRGSFSQEKDTILVRLERTVEKAVTDSSKVEALLNLGVYQLRRDFNRVETYADKVITILDKPNLSYDERFQRSEVFSQLGILNRKRANYTKALQYYLDSQKILLNIGDSLKLPANYHNIGTVYRYQKEYRKSIMTIKKAIRINQKLNKPRQEANNYNVIAGAYNMMKLVDSANYYYDKALEKYTLAGYEEGIHQTMSSKSNFFISQKKYKEALSLELRNLTYSKKIGKKTAIATSHYNLSRIYIGLKQFSKAITQAEAAITIAQEEGMGRRLALSYKKRSQAFYKMKIYDKALDDYRKYFKVHDSVFNVQKAKEIREIELNYKFEQQKQADSIQYAQEKKIIEARAENEVLRKQLYLILFIVTLILAIIIGYYGIQYFKTRWQKAEEVRKELDLLLKSSKEKSEQRMARLNEDIGELSIEIVSKKKEIAELMTESLQHLKSKERLVVDLKKLASNDEEISVQSIIADLKSEVLEDSRIQLIKNDLETLNHEFLRKIKTKHPNLTKTDLEICSYLKMSLGRQEIAKLRFTTLNAIKKTRNRLRKKMNLSLEDDLDAYIKSI